MHVSVATVHLVGVRDIPRIPDYLTLGAVVVVAPDRETLRVWEREADERGAPPQPVTSVPGLQVDLAGRRAKWNGDELRLTPLEFRVLANMARQPGRAWSFQELRESGWGASHAPGIDVFAVRSVVQRLRRKLRVAEATVEIQSVRGFGFRLEASAGVAASSLRLVT
jgi:DNA-binding response OmpR family regulator